MFGKHSKRLKEMKKQVASRMGGRKIHGFTCPHCHGAYTSKEGAHEHFVANVNKKKLPHSTQNPPPYRAKDPRYARLSIEQFEKKYPETTKL